MNRFLAVPMLALAVAVLPSTAATPGCSDTGQALAYWRPIRSQAAEAHSPADELALELIACLGSPDPELRDAIAYELFAYWLRAEKLSDGVRAEMRRILARNLADPSADNSLTRSFSALILAELMQSDARKPFMGDTDRRALLETAKRALDAETDFRGLDPHVGWVHPVAHMADLLWRFALHPATTPAEARTMLATVRGKIAPAGVTYTFNEGDRLARVVVTIIDRELLPPTDVVRWLEGFSAPQSMERWSDAFRTPAGMAELHDTKQFLRAVSDQLEGSDADGEIAAVLGDLVRSFTELI